MTKRVEPGRQEYQLYVKAWRQRLARQEEQQRVQVERLRQAAEALETTSPFQRRGWFAFLPAPRRRGRPGRHTALGKNC